MNISGEKVKLRGRTPEDFARAALWDLDTETTELNPHVGKTFNERLFSILTLDGEHVGTCSLYNQATTEVQLGIKFGRDYWNKGYGTDAVRLLVGYAFTVMNVERVCLKVLPWNTRAIRCYEKCGFLSCGRLALDGYDFTVMEVRR